MYTYRTHYSFHGMMMEKIMVLLPICPPTPPFFPFLLNGKEQGESVITLLSALTQMVLNSPLLLSPYLWLIYSKYWLFILNFFQDQKKSGARAPLRILIYPSNPSTVFSTNVGRFHLMQNYLPSVVYNFVMCMYQLSFVAIGNCFVFSLCFPFNL